MRALLALSFLLAALPLRANEIDYFCLFTNVAGAQANPAVGAYWHPATSDSPADWDRSQTNPGLSVVTPQAIVNGVSSATGFWIMISTFGPNAALDADTSCVMKLDRDAAIAGNAFATSTVITGANRTALTFSPVPLGSRYPLPLGQ